VKNLIFWLLSCFLITLFSGLAYAIPQQVNRQSANDPQIQIAEDMAAILDTGKNPIDAIPKESVYVNESLSPFVMIFDKNGKVLASNADIRNAAKTPPPGIFSFDADYRTSDIVDLKKQLVEESNRSRKIFTWQPAEGIRIASVMVKYKDGFVLSGRSLREVESRNRRIIQTVFVAWIVGLGATSAAFFLASKFKK
jgi:hypothetical protein